MARTSELHGVPMRGRQVDFDVVNAAALAMLPSLLLTWLPDGRRQAGEWVARNPRRDDRRIGSFSVNVRTGVWKDFATGDGGSDPVSLLAHIRGLGQAVTARELLAELGLSGGEWPRSRSRSRSTRSRGQPHRDADRHAEDAHLARRVGLARTIWQDTLADRHRGLVVAYLTGRAITLDPPPTIRSGEIWHPFERCRLPAMVAAIQQADGSVQGVHLTFLDPTTATKTPVEKPKIMFGRAGGGAVRLAPAGRRMALVEGIETGLSVQQACPELSVWCALSAGNLAKIALPPVVEAVTIFADGDENGVGECAALRAAEVYAVCRVDARVSVAPLGMDFNDVLRAEPEAELAA